jgi:hypothetical protein
MLGAEGVGYIGSFMIAIECRSYIFSDLSVTLPGCYAD